MGSRTLTKSPLSAHSSWTRGCRLGKGQLGPTDTQLTRPSGRSTVTTSALAAQRPQRMQRSLFLFSSPCLCPYLWALIDRLDGSRWRHSRRQGAAWLAPPSLAWVEPTFPIIFTGILPSHAVLDAIASPKTSDEEFLIGPVNRVGIRASTQLWMTRATCSELALPLRLSWLRQLVSS